MSMTRDDWLFVISETLKSDEVRDLIAWAIDCSEEERSVQAYHGYAAAALNAVLSHHCNDGMGGILPTGYMMCKVEEYANAAMVAGSQ